MLQFGSGNSGQVKSASAMAECIEKAADGNPSDIDVMLIHTTVGHNFKEMLDVAAAQCPNATVVGCTGSGVIHSEGVSEAMRAMAIMTIQGPEVAAVFRDGLDRTNGREIAIDAAKELRDRLGDVTGIAVFTAGFDVTGDEVIAGIEEIFGPDVALIGGIAADNGKARGSFQFHGQSVTEHGVILIGMADKSLELLWIAHHGSSPIGEPFEVTDAQWGHVKAFGGEPAWPQIMERLGLPVDTPNDETIALAGMGIELPGSEQSEYDNSHIMRVPLQTDDEGGFFLPTNIPIGTKLSLMQRDEEKIFEGVDKMMSRLNDKVDGREIVAVFHADCMARGRYTLYRVLKDEIITKMQYPLVQDSEVPWLGLYGYSEFCPLGGKNQFHSYTSSIFPLVRRRDG
jgi:hypothetical protein